MVKHFKTIADYCKAINIPQLKHPHFDIRGFEGNMPTVVHKMPPFRHEFYAIAIKAAGDGKAISGHHTDFPAGSTIFFNSPFQILSWDIVPHWKGHYIMFTQDFIAKSFHFSQLLEEFPFLRIDKSIPLEVEAKDMEIILTANRKIWTEYHGDNTDKFHLIEAYVRLLLNYIKRYYSSQMDNAAAEKKLRTADLKLLARYQTLIQTSLYQDAEIEASSHSHSTSYYARKLNVHHLNAVVKILLV